MASIFDTNCAPHAGCAPTTTPRSDGKYRGVPTSLATVPRSLPRLQPGVAEPCLEIAQDPDLSYKYTPAATWWAVISNGNAVLGLATSAHTLSKTVIEGKGVLFKKFADIDVLRPGVSGRKIYTFCQFCQCS